MPGHARKNIVRDSSGSAQSRFMNEDNPLRSSSAASSPDPAVSVSIPYGSESGGLFSMFKGMLHHRSDSSGSSSAETAPSSPNEREWEENPLFVSAKEEENIFDTPLPEAPAAVADGPLPDSTPAENVAESTVDESPSGDTQIADNHREAMERSRQIVSSTRRFGLITIKDGEFGKVKDEVSALLTMLDLSFPTTPGRQRAEIETIMNQYARTIRVLGSYVDHINSKGIPNTTSGKARLALVSSIIPQYQKDYRFFQVTAEQLISEGSAGIGSWNDVLLNARAKDLTRNAKSVKTVGAGSSVITKVHMQGGGSKYVKGEENLIKEENVTGGYVEDLFRTKSSRSHSVLNTYLQFLTEHPILKTDGTPLAAGRALRGFMVELYNEQTGSALFPVDLGKPKDMTDSEYLAKRADSYRKGQPFKNFIANLPVYKDLFDYIISTDQNMVDFADMAITLDRKFTESYTASRHAQISGEQVVSDRNVSTSILAERLGTADSVARSETVLVENGKGDVIRANSMEGAKGRTIDQLMEDIAEEEKADRAKKAAEGGHGPDLKISISYTPRSVMMMNHLLLTDMISGQVDRHKGNYICTVDKNPPDENGQAIWYITSVKGIDNDMAFGTMSGADLKSESAIKELLWFSDPTGGTGTAIHYISKDVYFHIMNYFPDLAAFDQRHLRNKEELAALKDRLRTVQKELKKRVESGQIMLVSNDEEMKEGYERTRKNKDTLRAKHYVKAEFLSESGAEH